MCIVPVRGQFFGGSAKARASPSQPTHASDSGREPIPCRSTTTDSSTPPPNQIEVFTGDMGKIRAGLGNYRQESFCTKIVVEGETGPMSYASIVSRNQCAVRVLPSEDGCFLLDIEHDRLLKLNTVGAEIWHLLSDGEDESRIIHVISRKYHVDEQRVATDVRAIVKRIAEFRLSPRLSIVSDDKLKPATLEKKEPSYPWYGQTAGDCGGPKPKGLTVLAAFVGLVVFDLVLSISSLKSLCVCVKAWPVRGRRSPDSNTRGQICRAVQQACVWYPKRALCLQRSAVTTCLLRTSGLAAQMVVGMRPMPFMAHAWVEVDNAVVNDWPGVTKFYRPLVSH